MLKLSEFTQILINITTELILPVVHNEPISLYQPLVWSWSQTAHLAGSIPDSPIQSNDDCRAMAE